MKKVAYGFITLIFVLSSALLLVSPTYAQSFDVQKAIAVGDHKGLAEYYKSQADAYRKKAAEHDNMHADYKKSHVHYKGMENTFSAHCSILKKDALNTADQYDALAKQEEKLAASTK